MAIRPSAGYSLTIRLEIRNEVGMLGRVTSAIGGAGGDIGAVDIVSVAPERVTRDFTIKARDEHHGEAIVEALKIVDGVHVASVSDRTFLLHMGGKIEIVGRVPVKTRDDLSMVYTPGVARVSRAIAEDPEKVFALTIKRNTVGIVTDGSAVLGLGDIGPAAALPVMEGKALLFKALANLNAFPICLDTRDPDEIVRTVRLIAPVFGGINLEDISAPRCFKVEESLKDLGIPVMHDDQHGTAVVVRAGLINASAVVGKRFEDLRIAVSGAGAAGSAIARLLLCRDAPGKTCRPVRDLIICDRGGIVHPSRPDISPAKADLASWTNLEGRRGSLADAMKGVDVLVGVSAGGIVSGGMVRSMAARPIVFALANPDPEILPDEAESAGAAVVATGRSDFPNQVNNALAFPGLFKGALDVRASRFTPGMFLAASETIASMIRPEERLPDHIIPSIFDRRVTRAVCRAVAQAAHADGVAARRHRDPAIRTEHAHIALSEPDDSSREQ